MLLLNKNQSFCKSIVESIKRNNWFWGLFFLTVVFLAINQGLLRGTAVAIWDADAAFMPFQTLVGDFARAGKFVLWDPWSNGGVPFAGDPQAGAFSPINFLAGLLAGGSTLGFRLYWLFIWWLGGTGILMLGRYFKVTVWGSVVIALGYLFSGIYITNAEHTVMVSGFSFIPLIIWRLDTALVSKRFIPAAQAGALWGLSALGGYPAFAILTLLFCGLWAIGRLFFAENFAGRQSKADLPEAVKIERPALRLTLLVLVLMTLIGALILSPTYFSFLYENVGTTSRTVPLSRETVLREDPLHPGAISSFASPYIPIQKLYNKALWDGTDVSMTSIYTGALILVLALFAVINNYRDKWRWFLVFLALFALTCALSQVFPFRGWLYDLVYPTRYFRHPAIFRAYYLFSVAVLALLGMRDLTTLLSSRRRLARSWDNFKRSSQILAVSAILVFISVINSLTALGDRLWLAYLHLLLIWFGICLLPYLKRILQKTLLAAYPGIIPVFLIALAIFDAFCTYRLSQAVIASAAGAAVQRWTNLDEQHSANLDLTARGLSRAESSCNNIEPPCYENNDHLIRKISVFNSYNAQVNSFQLAMAKNPVLKNMATGSDRIWFSPLAEQLPPTQENFEKFEKRASELGAAPLIIHTPPEMVTAKLNSSPPPSDSQLSQTQATNLENAPALEKLEVNLIKYTPEDLIFETTAPADGWLLVTDRWARMWQAEVNDQPTTVYGGNFIFRAVKVPAGHNTVRFVYKLISFPYLLILSWGLLGIVIIISIWDKQDRLSPAMHGRVRANKSEPPAVAGG